MGRICKQLALSLSYVPKTQRFEVALVAFALFFAVHLYEPSLSLVTLGRIR